MASPVVHSQAVQPVLVEATVHIPLELVVHFAAALVAIPVSHIARAAERIEIVERVPDAHKQSAAMTVGIDSDSVGPAQNVVGSVDFEFVVSGIASADLDTT